MSKERRKKGGKVDPKDLPKTVNGNTCCRWCQGDVYAPRRTFCSDNCVHEHRLRTNNKYLRECVYKRDKGICAECSIDTKLIAKELKQYHYKSVRHKELLVKYGISEKRKIWKRKYGGGLWDADHIKPVCKGGGLCGLENMKTLCILCHKAKTKKEKQSL